MENFHKKKSLGQNFLKNAGVLKKIVDAGEVKKGETVLEIGPGEGNLTEELLGRGAKVVAVEKDNRLIPILEQKFSADILSGNLVLIHSDILNFPPLSCKLQATRYKLVANIPYYITGEIIRKALSEWPQPSKIVLMIQKEVAERIVARDGKESLLSISVKVYGEPNIYDIVKAGSFSPAPKVDSAILVIENISKEKFSRVQPFNPFSLPNLDATEIEKKFFEAVKAGFAHKRKKLAGNLKLVFENASIKHLTACGISQDARPENLNVENWLCLASKLQK